MLAPMCQPGAAPFPRSMPVGRRASQQGILVAADMVNRTGRGETMPSEIIYSVFVSSTYEDLREERAAVQKALLQLHCMPIGMELFGSADEETWEFIKRQIGDCDYYVVIVADKYGSTAEDGVSYTEKEYDYAREINKPVLAFVHNNPEILPRKKTESEPEKRSKLEAFIRKIRRSPGEFSHRSTRARNTSHGEFR